MYANELDPYFESKKGETTRLNFELHFILSNMIKDYASLNLKELDIEEVNTNRVYYEEVVKDINVVFLGLENVDKKKWPVKEHDLVRICYPKKDPSDEKKLLESKIGKNKVSIIYKYFDKKNPLHGKPNGKIWINRFEELNSELVVVSENAEESQKAFLKVLGTIHIDLSFAKKVSVKNFTWCDFYLSKQADNCQWYGIIKGWDYERNKYADLKEEIRHSYSYESKVTAVIHGRGGSGKSTVLRRLAYDCIDLPLIVLWIENIDAFHQELHGLVRTPHTYLLFFDNWESIANTDIEKSILAEIADSQNIRMVIGDRFISQRAYRKFVLDNNYFHLVPDENEAILGKVLKTNLFWENVAIESLPPNIYSAPLFTILFVIARQKNVKKSEAMRDVVSRFEDIITKDMLDICDKLPGLAKAFYYLANIYQQYNIHFSWAAFLALADQYSDEKISDKLYIFNTQNYFCRILSNYIWVEKIIIPFSKDYIIRFHHNLLLENLARPIFEDWSFDINIKLEIAKGLRKKNWNVFVDFFYAIKDELENQYGKYENREDMVIFFEKRVDCALFLICKADFLPSFKRLIIGNETLKDIYTVAKENVCERQWHIAICVIKSVCTVSYADKTTEQILTNLVNLGCNSTIVKFALNELSRGRAFDNLDYHRDLYLD
ncbi:MAG: hypothetical protein WC797_03750 [Candidatus Paceibacterota bacterium]|jgi:hypothetical protein